MPSAPPKLCGRHNNVYNGKCNKCEVERKQYRKVKDNTRPNANARGYTKEWSKARTAYLSVHRYCVQCNFLATIVDHIIPHKGDMGLFWDKANWQSMCKTCHDSKTAKYDGGFGNKRII